MCTAHNAGGPDESEIVNVKRNAVPSGAAQLFMDSDAAVVDPAGPIWALVDAGPVRAEPEL